MSQTRLPSPCGLLHRETDIPFSYLGNFRIFCGSNDCMYQGYHGTKLTRRRLFYCMRGSRHQRFGDEVQTISLDPQINLKLPSTNTVRVRILYEYSYSRPFLDYRVLGRLPLGNITINCRTSQLLRSTLDTCHGRDPVRAPIKANTTPPYLLLTRVSIP